MPKVRSNLDTKIAYDGGPEAKAASNSMSKRVLVVELAPGMNVITDEQAEVLRIDPFFAKHVKRGFMSLGEKNADGLRTDGPTLDEFVARGYPAEKYPPEGYEDKRPKPTPVAEKPVQEKAPKKPAPDPAKELADFVATFLTLDAPTQAAMLPTLTPEQAAAVEKAKTNV